MNNDTQSLPLTFLSQSEVAVALGILPTSLTRAMVAALPAPAVVIGASHSRPSHGWDAVEIAAWKARHTDRWNNRLNWPRDVARSRA